MWRESPGNGPPACAGATRGRATAARRRVLARPKISAMTQAELPSLYGGSAASNDNCPLQWDKLRLKGALGARRASHRSIISSSSQTRPAEEHHVTEGTIKRLTDKGFGFISTSSGKDIFFHQSALVGVTIEELHQGQKVTFTEGEGPKGPRAEEVRLV